MRNLIASLVVVLFVSLSVNEVSAQKPGASTRIGIGINKPILLDGIGLTVDYDRSWSANRFISYGYGATVAAQRITGGFFGGPDSYLYSSLNAVGRLHIPLGNIKFRPTFTLTTGPAYVLNAVGSDRFDFDEKVGDLNMRASLALGHDGEKNGFSIYVSAVGSDIDPCEFGLKYYKRF